MMKTVLAATYIVASLALMVWYPLLVKADAAHYPSPDISPTVLAVLAFIAVAIVMLCIVPLTAWGGYKIVTFIRERLQ